MVTATVTATAMERITVMGRVRVTVRERLGWMFVTIASRAPSVAKKRS